MENEIKAMQNTPTLLHDMGKIPPIAVAITVILAMCVAGVLPWQGAVALIGLAWYGLNRIEQAQALREAKARAATFANCIGPVVVSSVAPDETVMEVEARAEMWREKLRLSGNPYAEKIPVIPFPYDPILLPTGEFGGGWTVYEKRVSEKRHMENVRWFEGKCPNELKSLFASSVFPKPDFQSAN